jgi:hypothetical protein
MSEGTNTEGASTPAAGTEGVGAVATPPTDPKATGTEGAPAPDKKGAPAPDKKGDAAKPTSAPEKYEDFKLPEGVEVPAEVREQYTGLFKELGLSQEAAQKLIDFQMGVEQKAAQALTSQWETTHSEWIKAIETDKDIGGDKLKESKAFAAAVLASDFATPELKEALNLTGAGNNPAVFKFFVKLGKAMADDKLVVSGKAPARPDDTAKKLFPNFN